MGGKGGFAELANWVIHPPGHGSVWGAPPEPAHSPLRNRRWRGGGGGGNSSGADDVGSAYMGEAYGGGEGTLAAGRGTTALRTVRPTGDAGGGLVTEAVGAAAAEAPRFAESVPSWVRLPQAAPVRISN